MRKQIKIFLLLLIILPLSIMFVACGKNKSETPSSSVVTPSSVIYYTVTFDSDGGSKVNAITNVESGKKVQEPTAPTKEGYIFDGWYLGEDKWSFVEYVVTENITLRAKWIDIFKLSGNKITGLTTHGEKLENIVIPEYIGKTKITSIGDRAFEDCSRLTSIEIPSSVTSIGSSALSGCSSLTSIEILVILFDNVTFSILKQLLNAPLNIFSPKIVTSFNLLGM